MIQIPPGDSSYLAKPCLVLSVKECMSVGDQLLISVPFTSEWPKTETAGFILEKHPHAPSPSTPPPLKKDDQHQEHGGPFLAQLPDMPLT